MMQPSTVYTLVAACMMILDDEKVFLNDIQEIMNKVRTFRAGMCISDEL